jgi:hypothetical protein
LAASSLEENFLERIYAVKHKLKAKYKKELHMPSWGDDEVRELGINLKTVVAVNKQKSTKELLGFVDGTKRLLAAADLKRTHYSYSTRDEILSRLIFCGENGHFLSRPQTFSGVLVGSM